MRTKAVIARFNRAMRYCKAAGGSGGWAGRTGSSAFADDDTAEYRAANANFTKLLLHQTGFSDLAA
jgi:hypothetical protein